MKSTAKPDVDPLDLTFADDAAQVDAIARARKRGHNEGPTPRQWAAALLQTRGLQWRAAALLGASRNTLIVAIEKCPALGEVAADARERMLDDAEFTLADKAISERDGECLRYLLKTVGRKRGYADKIEVDAKVSDGAEFIAALAATLDKADAAATRTRG